jgi:hypothetical protein
MSASSIEIGDLVRVARVNVLGKVVDAFVSATGEEVYDIQHHWGRVAALENDIVINYGTRPMYERKPKTNL